MWYNSSSVHLILRKCILKCQLKKPFSHVKRWGVTFPVELGWHQLGEVWLGQGSGCGGTESRIPAPKGSLQWLVFPAPVPRFSGLMNLQALPMWEDSSNLFFAWFYFEFFSDSSRTLDPQLLRDVWVIQSRILHSCHGLSHIVRLSVAVLWIFSWLNCSCPTAHKFTCLSGSRANLIWLVHFWVPILDSKERKHEWSSFSQVSAPFAHGLESGSWSRDMAPGLHSHGIVGGQFSEKGGDE